MTNKQKVSSKITFQQQQQQQQLVCLPKIRLSWYSNEEIYAILNNYDASSLTSIVNIRPNNGSVYLYDRNLVKNFKKDVYTWKRRRDSGNSVREDRMSLKINGVDTIYGCYSHNAFITTFHRRCYWLLAKPNIVLVHYLLKSTSQQPQPDLEDTESGDSDLVCDVNITGINLNTNLKQNDYLNELVSILWPYTLNQANYHQCEQLIDGLFLTNQLKKCLKLLNFNKILQKLTQNSPLNVEQDIPLIQITSTTTTTTSAVTPKLVTAPPATQNASSSEDTDIYLSKSSVLIDENDQTVYIVVRNEHKYKFNRELKYYIQILNNLFELSYVNTTLLEFKLNSKLLNLRSNNSNLLNTYLYLYDSSFNLIYKPFNFEVKYPSVENNTQQPPQQQQQQEQPPTVDAHEKYRLLILEKLLYIYNLMKLNVNIDFSVDFEQRLVSLVDYLNTVSVQQQAFEPEPMLCKNSSSSGDDDEDKNLLHLSVLCNFKRLFDSLVNLFKTVCYSRVQVVFNEVNPNKLDSFGQKPVDYAKKLMRFDFVARLNEIGGSGEVVATSSSVSQQDQFILNDDLSWLNEINEQNCLGDEHFAVKQPQPVPNEYFIEPDDQHLGISTPILQAPTPAAATPSTPYIDDQDKKIKTLADNIIAAMPMKIKSNSYSLDQSTVPVTSCAVTSATTSAAAAAAATIIGSNIDLNDFRQNSIISLSSTNGDDIYSSPLSSINSQNQSPSASNFHIDSPPSTAEFSKYFHAKRTYKTFENDFSQLTLTDDEQRELYEAALIIQNAYRRYLKRKRTRLDNSTKLIKTAVSLTANTSITSSVNSPTVMPMQNSINNSSSRISSSLEDDDDDDEDEDDDLIGAKLDDANISDDENQNVDTKQYEAACIIQKYFRRYKQYENLRKYNEATATVTKYHDKATNQRKNESMLLLPDDNTTITIDSLLNDERSNASSTASRKTTDSTSNNNTYHHHHHHHHHHFHHYYHNRALINKSNKKSFVYRSHYQRKMINKSLNSYQTTAKAAATAQQPSSSQMHESTCQSEPVTENINFWTYLTMSKANININDGSKKILGRNFNFKVTNLFENKILHEQSMDINQ